MFSEDHFLVKGKRTKSMNIQIELMVLYFPCGMHPANLHIDAHDLGIFIEVFHEFGIFDAVMARSGEVSQQCR